MKSASKFAILLAIFFTVMMLPLIVGLVSSDKRAPGGAKADAIHSIKGYAARNELALREIGDGAMPAAEEEDADDADSGLDLMREGVLKIFRSVGILSDEDPKTEPKKDPKIAHASR